MRTSTFPGPKRAAPAPSTTFSRSWRRLVAPSSWWGRRRLPSNCLMPSSGALPRHAGSMSTGTVPLKPMMHWFIGSWAWVIGYSSVWDIPRRQTGSSPIRGAPAVSSWAPLPAIEGGWSLSKTLWPVRCSRRFARCSGSMLRARPCRTRMAKLPSGSRWTHRSSPREPIFRSRPASYGSAGTSTPRSPMRRSGFHRTLRTPAVRGCCSCLPPAARRTEGLMALSIWLFRSSSAVVATA